LTYTVYANVANVKHFLSYFSFLLPFNPSGKSHRKKFNINMGNPKHRKAFSCHLKLSLRSGTKNTIYSIQTSDAIPSPPTPKRIGFKGQVLF
jgi:hypothetical protein